MFGDGTDPVTGTPITVTGNRPIAPPPVTGPTAAATPSGTPVAEAPKKKHIWQDILGAVGDAMLAQGGSKPMYQPMRQQQRIGDTMQGFDKDPMGTIKRVAQLDPALGERMFNNYTENEILKDGQAYAEMRAKRDDDLKRQEYEDKTFDVAFTMLGAPGIEKTYKQTRAQILDYLEKRGIDPAKANLPEEYDAVAIRNLYGTTKRAMEIEKLESLDAYRAGVLGIRNQRLQQTGANTTSQIADREVDNTRQAGDSAERVRHNRKTEEISASKGRSGRTPAPTLPGQAPVKKYDDNKMYTNAAGVTKSGKELNAMAK